MANVTAGGGDAESQVPTTTTTSASNEEVDDPSGYFSSYTDLKVHEVMLRDWPRNAAYRRFFEENPQLIQDKVVMDVGAGTGILSLFAASVGARKVYAVEASSTAHLCREIVEQNGMSDKIEVIHSTVEDATLPPGVKVDVIVSEWMGFYLLHESMLDSVIVARDRFLSPDGIVVPSAARLYLAPVDMGGFLEDKFDFWSNVCGFDFSAAIPHVHQRLLQEPLTQEIDQRQVVTSPRVLREFDLKVVTLAEVQALSDTLTFNVEKSSTVHGFAIWFDVDFRQGEQLRAALKQDSSPSLKASHPETASETVSNSPAMTTTPDWQTVPSSVLSTSPASPVTHWKQTVILLPRPLAVKPSRALCCKVTLTQNSDNKRHYNIELELVGGDDDDGYDDDECCDDSDDDDDGEDHPVPCDCGRGKCRLIRTLMEKYGSEQEALESEAEIVDLTAVVEAAETVGAQIGEEEGMNVSQEES